MLLSALILALSWSLSSAVLTPLSSFGDENECALYLSGPGRTSSYDYNLNLLRGNFGYEGQHTCITYDAVNRAYLEARKRILVAQPKGDWTPEDYASVGELILDISTNLARIYGLSYEEIEKGLPLIDTSRTLIREVCPPVFSHVECRAGKYRRLDGLCNNLEHPTWGAINAPFQRLIGPLFADGINSPRIAHSGRDLPLSRMVSRTMHPDDGLHDHAGTVMVIAWGQFMDHDYTLTGTPLDPRNRNDPEECCKRPPYQKHPYCNEIKIPDDDYFYRLFGVKCIDFVRAFPSPRPGCRLGSRIPFNTLTGVIDGNTVYGVTEKFGRKLRTGYGGLLRMNPIFKEYGLKDLLPLKLDIPDEGCTRPNKNMFCFEGGEIRVNEQLILTVMHTLMAREHNRVAVGLTSVNPHWDDETLYQEARRIVIAEIQHITYNEFLPILLGKDVMEKFGLVVEKEDYWDGYDPTVNPDVIASFAAAAYRFGHSLLPTAVERWSKAHKFIASKRLSELIRRPYDLYRAGVLDEYVMGLMNQVAQAMDDSITQEVTNHLFKKVGAKFGMDLVSFNMQRGREFGLPGYMEFRKFCGLPWTDDFQGLFGSMPNETVRKYEKLFEHPVDVDLWSGGVSEKPLPGSMLGPTFACIIATQFSYSKRGDRFWYELPNQPSSFTPEQLQEVRKGRLARIICDNTDIIDTVQLYPFVLPDPELNPRIPCRSGILPSIDFSKWAETPPFPGAAKQFMTRAFVPDRQVITAFADNNTTEILTTESIKQNQIVTTEIVNETTILPTTTPTISSTTTTTTTTTTTPRNIPREDINKILDILKNTTIDENLKDPLIAENTIVNTTTAVINCTTMICTKNVDGNYTGTQANNSSNTLESYAENTDIPEITKNVSENDTSNVERHRRSDFNNNKEPLKAPLLLNYKVTHGQREREDLLPPGVVKGSADFNIETLHDDPKTTTENHSNSGQYQQPYHEQVNDYNSQPNSKIIEQKGYKNQNPVNVKYHNHDGKISHEYVVLHDPSEINDNGKKHKKYVKNKPINSNIEISYYPPKQRTSNAEFSSEEDDQNQKKNNNKYESSRDYLKKKKPNNFSSSKHHEHKRSKDNDDFNNDADDEKEENSTEKNSSKEKYNESHSDHENLEKGEKEISSSAEDEDEEKPYRNLPVKYRNVKPKSYDRAESAEKVLRKVNSESEESGENYRTKPHTKERYTNEDESTESQNDSREEVSDDRDESYKYKSPPPLQKSKYETDSQTKRNHGVNDQNEKPPYYEHKPRASYESKERQTSYEKSKPNSYDGDEQLNQNHDNENKQTHGHVPYKRTYTRDENESDEKSNYEKSKKYSKPYTKKYTHDNNKFAPKKNFKNPVEDRYKSDQHEGTKQYYGEKIRNDNRNEDDSSSKADDIPYQINADNSRPHKEAHRTRVHDISEDDSRERDESEEDTSINKPNIKSYNKDNYRKYNSQNLDSSKIIENESTESDESSLQNRDEHKSKTKEKYRKTPIKNARYENHQAKSKKPRSKYDTYSDNISKKPHKIQEVDLSDFSHERIQLDTKGKVESIPENIDDPEHYEENENPENNQKYSADDSNEYQKYNIKKLRTKQNSEKHKIHNPNDSDEDQPNQDHITAEKYKKYILDDSIEHRNNDSYIGTQNKKRQRYQQYDPSPDGEKLNINVGDVKPVVELGYDSSSSSEEKDSDDKSASEDESLEDFLRKGVNARKNVNSYSNIRPAQIKESPNVKQQVERIPLNYKHDKKNAAKESEEQQNPIKETPVNDDDDDDEPEITQPKVPEKETRYDEKLNYKFDDVRVKLPEIKLPKDILDFNYEESFYEPDSKKNSRIYEKDDDEQSDKGDESDKVDENDDGVRHLHHHGDDDDREQEEDSEDEDDGHSHENYDYTSSPYKHKKKKEDVQEEFDFTKSPFERQKKAEEEEEDLYEKFVRERFGKRQQPEPQSARIHNHRILPSSPVLYHNLQKILHKTKKTMNEAEQSGDPNAGYAWTLEYAEPLVEI